jgi:uncharacterized protein YjbI with pentapeptide repeats
MANPEHVQLLRRVKDWNKWREDHPDIMPDLNHAHLSGAQLNEANLNDANLNGAHLNKAELNEANLSGA